MFTFQEVLKIIDGEIRAMKYPRQPESLFEPIAYLLALKGKKIRPAFTLLACNLYKEDVTAAVPMALAWEIFHNFTLMHDDVMDKADVRRGEPTVHKKWNENTAILSGDAMLILAYTYLAKSSPGHLKELLDLFSETASGICKGQEYDLLFENRPDVTEAEYLEMIRLKTAILLGAALKSGAIIGGAAEKDRNLLYDFGINLGLAFQIQDDLLDVFGDPAVFGKKIGGDILCNKKTYLLISALNSAGKSQKEELLFWLNSPDKEDAKIAAVTGIYTQLHVKEKAHSKMESCYREAIQAFQSLDITENRKEILTDLAKNLMNREF
ncbi:MAG: polyprenyl synthetase family protein [Candidatus Symbiothrix sp.]|nr:polyprenyl synthetase family protein [Candidatus Symbiothrix sp.]